MRQLTPEEQRIREYCEKYIDIKQNKLVMSDSFEKGFKYALSCLIHFIDTAPKRETCRDCIWFVDFLCESPNECCHRFGSCYTKKQTIERVKE